MQRISPLLAALILSAALPACSGDETDTDPGVDTEVDSDGDTDTDTTIDDDTDADTAGLPDLTAWGQVQIFDDEDNTTFRDIKVGAEGELIFVGDTSALGGTTSQLWSFDENVAPLRTVAFLPDDGFDYGRGFGALVTDDGNVYFSSSTKISSNEQVATIHRLTPTGTTLVEEYSIEDDIGGIVDYSLIREMRENANGDIVYAGFGAFAQAGGLQRERWLFIRRVGTGGGTHGGGIIAGGTPRDYMGSIDIADNGNIFGSGSTVVGTDGLDITLFRGTIDGAQADGISATLSTSEDDMAGGVISDGTDIFVSGSTRGILFGESGNARDTFIARFNGDLEEQWGVQIVEPGDGFNETITLGPDGHIYIAGATGYNGTVSQGFAASYTADGVERWTTTFGNGLNMVRPQAAVNTRGDLVITGWIRPTDHIEGHEFLGEDVSTTATTASFVVRLDPSDGTFR